MDICRRVMSAAAVLVLALAASCTMVEFTGSPVESFDDIQHVEKSHSTKVQFAVEWPREMNEEEMPQYITVVMNRIQNSRVHYVYHLDNMGDILDEALLPVPPAEGNGTTDDGTADDGTSDDGTTDDGTYEDAFPSEMAESEGSDPADEEETQPENDKTVPEDDEEVIPEEEETITEDGLPIVRNGFYSIAAVAVADFNEIVVPELEMFADSLDYSMKELQIMIPQLTKEEKIENQYIDLNPVYPYIRAIKPFYYVRPSVKTHTEIWTDGDEIKTVELKPQPLTRKIKVKVPIDIEEGVSVDRLTGAISGVPSKVQMMTGYVDDRGTGKMAFEMTSTDGRNFEGDINVFGLFAPEDTSYIAGPGILTLSLHVSTVNNGVKHSLIIYANVNMKKTIEAAEIMIQTEDRSAYRFSDTENTDSEGNYLEIKSFTISADKNQLEPVKRENIISGNGNGFTVWKPVADNENEEINPGLHPEV